MNHKLLNFCVSQEREKQDWRVESQKEVKSIEPETVWIVSRLFSGDQRHSIGDQADHRHHQQQHRSGFRHSQLDHEGIVDGRKFDQRPIERNRNNDVNAHDDARRSHEEDARETDQAKYIRARQSLQHRMAGSVKRKTNQYFNFSFSIVPRVSCSFSSYITITFSSNRKRT